MGGRKKLKGRGCPTGLAQPQDVEDGNGGGREMVFCTSAPAARPPWEEGGAPQGKIVYKHLRPFTAPADGATSFSSRLRPI